MTTPATSTKTNTMDPILIAQLLATFGPPAIQLVDTLIVKIEQGGTVSAAEWQAMTAQARVSAKDVLLQRITAAGLDPADPKVAALVAMAA